MRVFTYLDFPKQIVDAKALFSHVDDDQLSSDRNVLIKSSDEMSSDRNVLIPETTVVVIDEAKEQQEREEREQVWLWNWKK